MARIGIQDPTARAVNVRMVGAVSTAMVRYLLLLWLYDELFLTGQYAVCETDDACRGFPLGEYARELGIGAGTLEDDDEIANNMTCYKGGETVFRSHQMCDVTSMPNFSQVSHCIWTRITHLSFAHSSLPKLRRSKDP